MDGVERTRLRAGLEAYTKRSTPLGIAILSFDIAVYLAAVAGAVLFESWLLSLVCAVIAGLQICALFVIAHDAAHGAYTASKVLNRVVGRIAFLPALHNFSLWQIVHNRQHHADTNLKGHNSWAPFSKQEFDALPAWRKSLERLYRQPLGLGPYYLVERWWKEKFFPTRRVVGGVKAIHWLDFVLLGAYLAIFLIALGYVGGTVPQASMAGAVFWGFGVPFLVWNSAMGFTIYLHHTNLRVPWLRSRAQQRHLQGQEEVTVHVAFPAWYGIVSHNIMEHTAHHLRPGIPLYNLKKAEARLHELLGDRMIRENFSFRWFLNTMVRCKLYDYETHRWLDFSGRPTSQRLLTGTLIESKRAQYASGNRAA